MSLHESKSSPLTRVHRHHLASGPRRADGIRVPAAVSQGEVWEAVPITAAVEKCRTASEP